MKTLYKYQVYCNTEQAYFSYWAEENTTIVCPNNLSHSINTSATTIVGTISDTTVTINEETPPEGSNPTGGHFSVGSLIVGISAEQDIVETDVIFPFQVSIKSASFTSEESMRGDLLEVLVAPHQSLGIITSPVSIGITKQFSIATEYLSKIEIGHWATLFNGVTQEEMGRIIDIDRPNYMITTENYSTTNFAPGSLFQLSVRIANIELGAPSSHSYGLSSIGSSYIPTGVILRGRYHNRTGTQKKFYFYYEYFY